MILRQVICDAIIGIAGDFSSSGPPIKDLLIDVIGVTLPNSSKASDVGGAHPLAVKILCKKDLH